MAGTDTEFLYGTHTLSAAHKKSRTLCWFPADHCKRKIKLKYS